SLKLNRGRVTKKSTKKPKKSKKKTSTKQQVHEQQPPDEPMPTKTAAEQKHAAMLQRRKMEQIEKLAEKSYRDQVKDFNDRLEQAPEQHDMPRLGDLGVALACDHELLLFGIGPQYDADIKGISVNALKVLALPKLTVKVRLCWMQTVALLLP
ncbi:hypothetical protein IW145_005575, partial [Coemansia sp. RSA 521]